MSDAEPPGGGDQDVIRVARRVYVGNLAWRTTWQDLKDYFSRCGAVKYADVLREGGPGSRSKGCGIVEYEAPEEAVAAIQTLNHTDLDGRQIFVREDREDYELRPGGAGAPPPARPPPPVKRLRGGGAAGGGAAAALSIGRRVYVGNLSYDTTWQELKDHFKAAGRVVRADVLAGAGGSSKGCGLVEFEAPADALRAISLLSNSQLGGRTITVREDREEARAPAGRGGGGGGGGAPPPPAGAPADGVQVVVHGLPWAFTWRELKDLARGAAPPGGGDGARVLRADVMCNPDGSSKGYGVVAYASAAGAAAGIGALNGAVVDGRVLAAKLDKFAMQAAQQQQQQ